MSATVSVSRSRPMRSASSTRRTASDATFGSISGNPAFLDSSKQSRSRMPRLSKRRDASRYIPASVSRTIGPWRMRTSAPSSIGFSVSRRSPRTSLISWRSKNPEPPLVTYGIPCRLSSSSNSRGSMRTECDSTAMSRKARPSTCSRRMVSATERASVRESGAIRMLTGAPLPAPRVATSSGSAAKSESRRMKSVAQSRMP